MQIVPTVNLNGDCREANATAWMPLLRDGITTIDPMEAAPCSACRAAFVDRFGIRWGIMTERACADC